MKFNSSRLKKHEQICKYDILRAYKVATYLIVEIFRVIGNLTINVCLRRAQNERNSYRIKSWDLQ